MTEADNDRRGIAARIGICALNLLSPGLGLIRLAQYRLGAYFILSGLLLTGALLSCYALVGQFTFGLWAALIGVAIATTLVIHVAAIIVTWRQSGAFAFRSGWVWRWYGLLGIMLILFGLAMPAPPFGHRYYKGYYVPSEAMLPTIHVNDRYLADMHDIDPIKRGDIVIAQIAGISYVKRVAGVPGDRIAMKDGIVVLNGAQVRQQFVSLKRETTNWEGKIAVTISREQFPGEAIPHLVMDKGRKFFDEFSEVVLPQDHYFLLGDNRDASADSRFPRGPVQGMGLVPREAIIGRIAFRYWRSGEGFGPGED